MNFRTVSSSEDVDINLTPLIDVVFLLLIFFMVSTTFREESEITINLPEATQDQPLPENEVVEISIDDQGRFYVDNVQVVNTRLVTVKKALAAAVGDKRDLTVVISADAKTPHQSVITAMDAARQLGLVRLSIATRNQEK